MDGLVRAANGDGEDKKKGGTIKGSVFDLVVVVLLVVVNVGVGFLAGGSQDQVIGSVIEPFWGPLTVVESVSLLAMVVNWIAYVPAIIFQNEKFYDLVGSITYQICIWYSFAAGLNKDALVRPLIASIMVAIWSARLGSFLFKRISKDGGDDRFDEIKVNPTRFLLVWTLQGTWVFFTALAAFIINADSKGNDLNGVDIFGICVWVIGFATEVVADQQKRTWRSNPDNKGKFIEYRLWYYSRHPNYLGEMTIWWGMFFLSVSILENKQFIAILSPIFVFSLIYFVSGVRLLEQKADARWGGQPDYENYKATTSKLLILPKLGKRVHQGTEDSDTAALQGSDNVSQS